MELQWERSDTTTDGRSILLLWANGGDFEAFEAALDLDETVASPSRVVRFGERRLYQLELQGEGLRKSVYPTVVEEGGVIRDLSATHEGWDFRISFPTAGSFDRFYDVCRDNGFGFTLHRIYEEQDGAEEPGYGLTSGQCDVLVAAAELGYLAVPRRCSLAELADYLGISENAASERFRRGVKTLVENTVYDPGGSAVTAD